MKKSTQIVMLVCLLLSAPLWASDTLEDRLAQADSYRIQGDSMKTSVEVSQYKSGELDKQSLYDVYTKADKGTLVLFQNKSEVGQKLLMVDDNFWMFLPRSRRPIRITPMQKMLGDASAGDISTLSWSDSYSITLQASDVDVDGMQATELSLKSVASGGTYDRIQLFLADEDNFPLKADLYLKSGKLAKTATFERGERDGKQTVVSMSLKDGIQTKQETIIVYQSSEPIEIQDKVFNPAYLVKNEIPSL